MRLERAGRAGMLGIAALMLALSTDCVAAQDLLIRQITVVSPERDTGLLGRDVLIHDGRIVALGQDLPVPTETQVINGAGRYLTPGLIDSHTHVWHDAGIREDLVDNADALAASFEYQEPRSYLYWGFTTLLDLSKSKATVDRWNQMAVAPHLYACRGAPYANDYAMYFLEPEDRFATPYYLYDPAQASSIPPEDDPVEHTPEAVVGRIAEEGEAPCVKTYYEPGFAGLFDFNLADTQTLYRVARAAETHGLVNFLHGNSLASWRVAVDADVTVLAHGLWHWDELNGSLEREPDRLPGEITELVDRLIAQDTAFQMTIRVIAGEVDVYDDTFLDNPELARVVPPALLDWYRTPDGHWFRGAMDRRIATHPEIVSYFLGSPGTGEPAETSRRALRRLELLVPYIQAHGGRFLLGSDTPSSPTYTNPPGLNSYWEMRALEDMGLTPLEVFRAATLSNAEVMGLASEIGSVEVGKRADLLILAENPLESVTAFSSLERVILGGIPMDRASFAADNPAQADE